MKMVFLMNGSKKRTLESFYPKEELRENTKIINKDKQLERQITFNTFTSLKNSNGTPFNSSTKLPVTISNDALMERPILNLHGYKINMIDRLQPFNNCSSCGK
jgi:hypothetical protein